jgi:hypothetical protein
VKGFLFAVGFTVLALESACTEEDGGYYYCGRVVGRSNVGAAKAVRGASIFAAIISSLQVVLGVHATRVVCCPPHTSLTSDYIVWIILTLCEVPGFLAGWAFAIVMWVNSPGVRYDDPGLAGETIAFTVPLIALVTSFLIVTATLTHSFRPKNESVTEDSLRMALLKY